MGRNRVSRRPRSHEQARPARKGIHRDVLLPIHQPQPGLRALAGDAATPSVLEALNAGASTAGSTFPWYAPSTQIRSSLGYSRRASSNTGTLGACRRRVKREGSASGEPLGPGARAEPCSSRYPSCMTNVIGATAISPYVAVAQSRSRQGGSYGQESCMMSHIIRHTLASNLWQQHALVVQLNVACGFFAGSSGTFSIV